MSTFRQKVFGFIRQLSASSLEEDNTSDNFIQNYLKGKEIHRHEPDILHGRSPQELPPRTIGNLCHPILSSMTGPKGGLTAVNKQEKHVSVSDPDIHFIDDQLDNPGVTQDINFNLSGLTSSAANCSSKNFVPLQKSESAPICQDSLAELKQKTEVMNTENEVAGVTNWNRPHNRAYGASTTLYELHPLTKMNAGEPIADCFAVVARKNSAILVLADGVNWGQKACIAARAAVHGCVDYLNKSIFSLAVRESFTTTDIFRTLLRSFNSAHNLILQEEGMLTTLTAVVVLPLTTPGKYIACCCNVGDSLAYVFNPKCGVRELTQGSHDVYTMRDMRDALGALGPVDGQNPELTNLTLAMTEVEPGDLVFVTSDGVSDNLDPVIGKFAGLPTVEAYQRHKLTLLRTEDLLRNGVSGKGPSVKSAKDLVVNLLDFVTRLTAAKRRILEDVDLYVNNEGKDLSRSEQRTRRKEINGKLCMVPGKLDHATVAAYAVGELEDLTT